MTENPSTPVPSGNPPAAATGGKPGRLPLWLNRTILVAAAVVVLAVVYLIASVTVPVMWAHTIGNQVQGNLGTGIMLGIVYGFAFSFLPIVVGWQAHYKGMKKWLRISILVLAVVLAVPNLLTLAVLNGTQEAAHNAQRILSVEASWFGGWSVWFMVVGAVVAIGSIVAVPVWRRRSKRIREYKIVERAQRKVAETERKAEAARVREAEKAAAKAARDAERGKQP